MNEKFQLTYFQFNSKSILITWQNSIKNEILYDVFSFKRAIELSFKPILEVRNAYNSLLVSYDSTIDNIYSEFTSLKSIYNKRNQYEIKDRNIWKIPVCYNDYFGKDLETISDKLKLEKKKIIQLHYENTYTICFLGFLPGFLYLSNLNKKLYFPRKIEPELNIIKGSVAIGGSQTGVYPSNSPGGWNVIGNSPIDFINNSNKGKISFAKPGDLIKFHSITIDEHEQITNNLDTYIIESEVSND
ncbi:allophanate hydrolase subunit 1 [Flavobacteriaceae bacterium]|nr:allophanate hydrolase subunit 1 [Flavobacteriaceae bacterium]MDC1491959.1 allophanate hydrolase subunit 1 [Flavobacteriaceae bacterium]